MEKKWPFPLTTRQDELIRVEKERRIVAALVALQELLKAPEVGQLIGRVVLSRVFMDNSNKQLLLNADGNLYEEDTITAPTPRFERQRVTPTRAIVMLYQLKAEDIQALHLALQVSDPKLLIGD